MIYIRWLLVSVFPSLNFFFLYNRICFLCIGNTYTSATYSHRWDNVAYIVTQRWLLIFRKEFSVFPPCHFVLLTVILIAEYCFIEWRTYFGSAANIFSFRNHFFFVLLSDTYFLLVWLHHMREWDQPHLWAEWRLHVAWHVVNFVKRHVTFFHNLSLYWA